eukprot:scaffold36872_cov34-Prasinocladus_malaysianus.AAC.1
MVRPETCDYVQAQLGFYGILLMSCRRRPIFVCPPHVTAGKCATYYRIFLIISYSARRNGQMSARVMYPLVHRLASRYISTDFLKSISYFHPPQLAFAASHAYIYIYGFSIRGVIVGACA